MTEVIGAQDFESIKNAEPNESGLIELAVIPLHHTIVYPGIVVPVTIIGERALAAARTAHKHKQTVIGLATRSDDDLDNPQLDDLFDIGTEIALGRIINLPDRQKSTLAEGRRRVEVVDVVQTEPYLMVRARPLAETARNPSEISVLEQTLINLFENAVDLNENLPEEVLDYAINMGDPGWLADFVTSTMSIGLDERQEVLEMLELGERMRHVASLLTEELNMLELRDEIDGQIQQEMARTQREVYLREQMRVIQNELGEADIIQQEIDELRQQIDQAGMTAEAYEKAQRELLRLQTIPPMAPEVGIIRTYLDWMVSVPWSKDSEDNLDLKSAERILDAEHHGLKRVKDRIIEHIAVRKLAAEKMKSPILCFVGPPGVGKTSMGQSIAKALGREFVRVSLGGVRDEAEIRGHRRTYIGAMPGRIVQTMRRAGTINPVFMLDEIDKLGADFRGDPAAALLEVLDPEQNVAFSDHYLDVPYDLSRVMFITTANDLYPLAPALLDRMEVIEFPGYTEEDKLEIARLFLVPKQLEAHGLENADIHFQTSALQTIIREYTYEAGVRNFYREIGTVCRKITRLLAEDKRYPRRVTSRHINTYLGPPEYLGLRANDVDSVGIATGLAWTSNGGDVLTIEVSLLPGKGSLTLTGQLGEIMQESAQTALSYMRWRARDLDVPNDDFENYDIHVHLPEGAIPKDGPSAGITLAAAIISVFTERKIRSDTAMTGEITLRGRVLAVGGIKEKLLAAHRAHIRRVIVPEANRKDMVEVPASVQRKLNIIFVDNMQQVIDAVLLDPPSEGRERDRLSNTDHGDSDRSDERDDDDFDPAPQSRRRRRTTNTDKA